MSGQTTYGKGDRQRPRLISYEEWELRFDLSTGKIDLHKFNEKMKELKKKAIKK
jgi:hypothetical protein